MKETNAELLRRLRAEAVADHLCYGCRLRPPNHGFKACEVCLAYKRRRLAKFKKRKLCKCGRRRQRSRRSCARCLERARASREKRRIEKRGARICPCCSDPVAPGRAACEHHLGTQAARARRRWRRRHPRPDIRVVEREVTSHGVPYLRVILQRLALFPGGLVPDPSRVIWAFELRAVAPVGHQGRRLPLDPGRVP